MKTETKPNIIEIDQLKTIVLLDNLLKQIENSKIKFDYVVGIANGGLHISKPLAEALNIPHKSIKISFYKNGKLKNTPKINLNQLKNIDNTKKILFVDDLIDSGSSLNYIKQNIHLKYKTAVLFRNKNNKYKITPDFYAEEKPDAWIKFHWEK